MGRHETPQTEVRRHSAYRHCFAAPSGGGLTCMERMWGLVPLSRNRFGMRYYYGFHFLCFEASKNND